MNTYMLPHQERAAQRKGDLVDLGLWAIHVALERGARTHA